MQSLTIGKLASAAGVNLETVRFYERIGLMPPPARTAAGHRAYEQIHLKRLSFIRRSRELGFSIEDIRALLALAEPPQASCAMVREIAQSHLDDVQAKIVDLIKLEGILASTIAQCNDDTSPSCPVLNMLAT